MQPDVSFIIAAHNAEATVGRAIESALAQTGVGVEVVVADDCSHDRTTEIVCSFPATAVKLVRLPMNLGPGGARNAALAAATGRWLAILDSDDTVQPGRTARLLELAWRNGSQIVVDNLEIVHETTGAAETMFDQDQLAAHLEIGLAAFIRSNVIFKSAHNFGYMKPVIESGFIREHELRYDEALRIGEDFIFLASALARGAHCAVEPTPGYIYHIRDGSISRVLELRHVEAMIAADNSFMRRHTLDSEAREAFAERQRSLREAASFLLAVQHLKARAPLKALAVALKDPGAMRHFSMPLNARLRRIGLPVPAMQAN